MFAGVTRVVALLLALGMAQASQANGFKWPGGAKAAVSLSYDDALNSQLTLERHRAEQCQQQCTALQAELTSARAERDRLSASLHCEEHSSVLTGSSVLGQSTVMTVLLLISAKIPVPDKEGRFCSLALIWGTKQQRGC